MKKLKALFILLFLFSVKQQLFAQAFKMPDDAAVEKQVALNHKAGLHKFEGVYEVFDIGLKQKMLDEDLAKLNDKLKEKSPKSTITRIESLDRLRISICRKETFYKEEDVKALFLSKDNSVTDLKNYFLINNNSSK